MLMEAQFINIFLLIFGVQCYQHRGYNFQLDERHVHDKKWKSCIGQTASSTERISCIIYPFLWWSSSLPSFIHSWYMTEPGKSSSPDFINHSFLLLQSLSYVDILYRVSPRRYTQYLPEPSHLHCKNFLFIFFTETPALRSIQ